MAILKPLNVSLAVFVTYRCIILVCYMKIQDMQTLVYFKFYIHTVKNRRTLYNTFVSVVMFSHYAKIPPSKG